MARTEFMIGGDGEVDLDSLNLTRLLARLEQNILSSSADLKLLRQSRYHRARVGAVRPPLFSPHTGGSVTDGIKKISKECRIRAQPPRPDRAIATQSQIARSPTQPDDGSSQTADGAEADSGTTRLDHGGGGGTKYG